VTTGVVSLFCISIAIVANIAIFAIVQGVLGSRT